MKRVAMMMGCLFVLAACQTDGVDPGAEEQSPEEEKEEGNSVNDRAVTDEYTRKHLVSEEQTEPGYYTFESELGKFQMLIPEEAVIDPGIHSTSDGTSELLDFGNYGTDGEKGFDMHIHYRSQVDENSVEHRLDRLKSELDYEGDYEEVNTEQTAIYYASRVEEFDKGLPFYVYFGYVVDKEYKGGLQVQYSVECLEEEGCTNIEEEREFALRLLQSIQFN